MLDKLKLNKEFLRVYGRGKSNIDRRIITYVLKRRADGVRFGITAGKKVGCAVKRNRAKRLIYAAFRECKPFINEGCDIVFVARPSIFCAKSYELAEIMRRHLKSSGVYKENDK